MAPAPHLVHVCPTFATGGIQTVLVRVINALGRRYRHTVLSLDGRTGAAARLASDVAVEVRDGRGIRGLLARRRALAATAPELLLTYNWGSMDWVAAHLVGRLCPHLHAEHGFGADEAFARLSRRNWARRLLLRRVDGLVVPSAALARIARREWRLPEDRILLVPNGVEGLDAVPEERADGPLRVGTLVPLRAEKRIDRLIRLVDRLPDAPEIELVVGGDGPEAGRLHRLRAAARRPERIRFAGQVEDVPGFLRRLDLFVLTSDTEQMPASALEAMAAGLPVVAFDVGDLRDMVSRDNRSYIVPGGDEAAFVASLTTLLTSPDLRRAIGAANRARQRRVYALERMVEAYDGLWRRYLGTESSASAGTTRVR